MSDHVLTPIGVQNYLRHIVSISYKDFYRQMKSCPLIHSYTQESELGWFIIMKIKDHMHRRFEDSRAQLTSQLFSKKGKYKKGRHTNNKEKE